MPFGKPSNSNKIAIWYIVDDGATKTELLGQKAVAEFLGTTSGNVNQYIISKKPYRKKYMIYKKSAV